MTTNYTLNGKSIVNITNALHFFYDAQGVESKCDIWDKPVAKRGTMAATLDTANSFWYCGLSSGIAKYIARCPDTFLLCSLVMWARLYYNDSSSLCSSRDGSMLI